MADIVHILVMRLAMNKATILQFQIKASLPDFVSQLWSKVWKSGMESLGSRLTEFCSGDFHDYVIYSSIDYLIAYRYIIYESMILCKEQADNGV